MQQCGNAVGALATLMALYIVTYIALVVPTPLVFVSGVGPWRMNTHYRIGGAAAAILFAPLEALDRKLFPSRWLFDF